MKSILCPLGCLILVATASQLTAATITTNVALAGTVADSSNPNATTYAASHVIDNNVDESTNAPVSFWLAPSGVTNAYFILDLHGMFPIESIVLYNTHDRQYFDRGTGPFVIYGGDALEPKLITSGQIDDYYPFDTDVNDYGSNQLGGAFYDIAGSPLTPTFSTNVPAALTNDTGSLAYSGGGEYLEIMDPTSPTAYSISVWVNLHVVQPCNIFLRTDANGPEVDYSHQLRVTAAGTFETYAYDYTGAKNVTGTTVIQPDTWYNVVVTAQNGGYEHLYVNGMEEGTPASIATLWTGGDRWWVGSLYMGVSTAIDGEVDDLAFWFGNTTLQASQIAALAAGQSPATVNAPATYSGYEIVNPQVVTSGTLSAVDTVTIPPQTFAVSPPVTARYLQFQILGSAYTNNNVGLNEMQVMAQVDPSVTIQMSKGVFLSWPYNIFNWALQSSPSLTTPVWTTVTNAPTLTGTNWGLFLPATNTAYYRLVAP